MRSNSARKIPVLDAVDATGADVEATAAISGEFDPHIRGMISGDLIVEAGWTRLLDGMVSGNVISEEADLSIDGMNGRR